MPVSEQTETLTQPLNSNMARSESFAYASANSKQNQVSRMMLYLRSHSTAVTATVGFLIFVSLVTSDSMMEGGSASSHSNLRS